MSKKMTPAMRLWRDENMEAIREGVKAVKEGRITPADTFFEWMQAKYVRDIWEERIARLQARVEEAETRATKWTEARPCIPHTDKRDSNCIDCWCLEAAKQRWRAGQAEALAERRKKALVAIHKRATPRSQDFLHPTKEFADDVASMARAAIEEGKR